MDFFSRTTPSIPPSQLTMSSSPMDRLLAATDEYLARMTRGIGTTKRPSNQAGPARDHSDEQPESLEEVEDNLAIVTSQPSLITNCTMRPYQIEGLDWMAQMFGNGMNGILADEMGLGKTLQSISLLALAKERGWPISKLPHLVVCPKSTITNWENEVRRFCPSLIPVALIGTADERQSILNSLHANEWNILITSFDVVRIEISVLKKIPFGFFILDEAHRIKNEESILSSVVRMVNAERILLLTGTPLQNNLHELWSILNFIMPKVFDNSEEFDRIFNELVGGDSTADATAITSTLHRILRPFMLRRLKTDVARDLPEKKELYVYVDLSPMQKQIYREIILKNADSLIATSSIAKVRLVNTLMQLRKVCNHPYLFPGIEPGPPYVDGPHLVSNSGKMVVLDHLIKRILLSETESGQPNQILIFSQMTKVLDILEDYLRMQKFGYCRIDGSTASSDRQMMIDEFTRTGTDKRVFLLSTRAGGLGINLVSANFVFIFDADFNPQADLQAIDRAHRIGQTRPVTVYRFVSKNTVEEKIIEKAAKKLLIDKMVIQKGRFNQKSESAEASKEELGKMLKFGVTELFADETSSFNDEIDALLEFSQSRSDQLNDSLKSFDQFVLKFENPVSAMREFEETATESSVLPEIITLAAANPTEEFLEPVGPRERKPVLPPPPKRTAAPPVIKTKLAVWRAQVGGGHDYQFYDTKRLDELERMEKEKGKLTDAQKAEQSKLMAAGFPNWSRRFFQTVVRTLEEFGNTDESIAMMVEQIPERSEDEIVRYVDVLLESGQKYIGPYIMNRIHSRLKKLEKTNQVVSGQMDALDRKMDDAEGIDSSGDHNPWVSLPVDSPPIEEGSPWTNNVDRILLCGVAMYGYGSWGALKSLLRISPPTAFNFPVYVVSEDDLKERVDDLLEIVEEEFPAKKRKSNKGK
jgi:SWI/SNF-related matrix-associated actin-dependent regulator of chromatin subfamily A member 5